MDDSGVSPYGNSSREEMLHFVPVGARRILDVGCFMGGFGHNIKAKFGAEVWGVEPNVDAAAFAGKRLDHVFNGLFDADLALPKNYFDVICFNDVLEHMPDPCRALCLAVTLLAPGGCIIASVPNLRHIDTLIHIIWHRDFRYEKNGVRDTTHLRFYTKKSLPRLFEEAGLTVMKLEGVNEAWWSPFWIRRLAFRLFDGYFSDTRHMQFAVVAIPKVVETQ